MPRRRNQKKTPTKQDVEARFMPMPDITAYELGLLLHHLITGDFTEDHLKALEEHSPGITRHLDITRHETH